MLHSPRLADSAPPSHWEWQYLNLMRRIRDEGDERIDRTGIGTRALFGAEIRCDLSGGRVPLLTTKRVYWKEAARELLWFLTDDTNIRPSCAQGVDNWLLPRFDNSVPIAQPAADFAFQALAGPMRGFNLNIRNGNSYALINTELRLPVFRMLSRRIGSNFLRNFQVVGFFDAGTAWEGSDPFSTDNPRNSSVITNGNRVIVKINYFREPVVAGYGVGIRSMLFGYFVRADYAWGIETRTVQRPKLFLALGLDF